ncbi:hypothetical protein AKJ61_03450 [candidate division MSBL1 archaeon SCGC-AAA259B11]|uniref:PIN domain-containing protein n=1 Tax=candidate division MSBL1 archaeon SCGC-AAA259B11 TaxID=1698260 RepID=A0A133U4Q5_9EURY|nr:hypothetical protein AKJ61_03450 [candidate division MSBL1 archaeon SCGC-AAA259B11]
MFDTDVVIEMVRDEEYETGAIPIITVIEVLRGVKEEKRSKVKQLLENSFDVLGLENRVIMTYCRLHRVLKEKGETLPDADLLVASTAIAYDLVLKSGDGHFERVEEYGLALEKPE